MKSFKLLLNSILIAGLVCFQWNHAEASSITIDFDHLASLPAVTGASSFSYANGGSLTTQGVTFASSFEVVGDQYRIAAAPSPTFGVPRSGHYFLSNGNTPNDNLSIQTTLVLTEAWFGRNEYYGYGGGSTSVTVTAFGSSGDLGSETTLLPDTYPYTGNLPGYPSIGNGLPDPLVKLDTSSFLGLSGITGYRISRVATGPYNGDWVGDDFTFTSASTVPEPTGFTTFGVGLLGVTYILRRQKRI